jgi:hypothetical protein
VQRSQRGPGSNSIQQQSAQVLIACKQSHRAARLESPKSANLRSEFRRRNPQLENRGNPSVLHHRYDVVKGELEDLTVQLQIPHLKRRIKQARQILKPSGTVRESTSNIADERCWQFSGAHSNFLQVSR